MRVWMDADRLSALGIGPEEVVAAIGSQNIQASIGSVGATPDDGASQMVYTLKTEGRLNNPADFENIIVRTDADGAVVYLRDVARIEKGADNYMMKALYNGANCCLLYTSPSPRDA